MTNFENFLDQFDSKVKNNILSWLNGPYDKKTKSKLKKLLENSDKNIADSFYKNLYFGTGGIRALMGIGTNRLNIYTVSFATQGLANYLKKVFKNDISVVIGYDSRHFSKEFAKEAAMVLAGNGIKAKIFKNIKPTPYISFACRYLKASAAVMITASHNGKKYNGYKVSWSDGAQVLPPHDIGIIEEYKKIHGPDDVQYTDFENSLIEELDTEIDKPYFDMVYKLQLLPKTNYLFGSKLKVLYTNLHGAGIATMPKAMGMWGFKNLKIDEKQKSLDGNFPFAPEPNPEEMEALKIGIEELLSQKLDILIANDPDADRMAAVVNHNDKALILTGNQIAVILLEHILSTLTFQDRMQKKPACVKSIVTTELFKEICTFFKTTSFDVLTGFKYIAEKIFIWENKKESFNFIFGAEESYGYLYETFVRDKDGTIASCLLSEVALFYKLENKTLVDALFEIYKKYGTYREKLHSIKFLDSSESIQKIEAIMKNVRTNPPKELANLKVDVFEDLLLQTGTNFKDKKEYVTSLPKSNVLLFGTSDNSKIILRPSGTEPKIKIYVGVIDLNKNIEQAIKSADEKCLALIKFIEDEIFN